MARDRLDEQLSEQAHKELLAVFEDRVANIRDLKRYEWQAAYYALALLSALVAIAHWSASGFGFRILLALGCVVIAWLWYQIEDSLREGLERQWDGLDRIYVSFSQQVREARPTIPADRGAMWQTLRVIVLVFTIGAAIAVLSSG
jgi:hypothetical protein